MQRFDVDCLYMEDVSVYNAAREMLVNGGFESGSFSPRWIRTASSGGCQWLTSGTTITNFLPHTGTYRVDSECNGAVNEIS